MNIKELNLMLNERNNKIGANLLEKFSKHLNLKNHISDNERKVLDSIGDHLGRNYQKTYWFNENKLGSSTHGTNVLEFDRALHSLQNDHLLNVKDAKGPAGTNCYTVSATRYLLGRLLKTRQSMIKNGTKGSTAKRSHHQDTGPSAWGRLSRTEQKDFIVIAAILTKHHRAHIPGSYLCQIDHNSRTHDKGTLRKFYKNGLIDRHGPRQHYILTLTEQGRSIAEHFSDRVQSVHAPALRHRHNPAQKTKLSKSQRKTLQVVQAYSKPSSRYQGFTRACDFQNGTIGRLVGTTGGYESHILAALSNKGLIKTGTRRGQRIIFSKGHYNNIPRIKPSQSALHRKPSKKFSKFFYHKAQKAYDFVSGRIQQNYKQTGKKAIHISNSAITNAADTSVSSTARVIKYLFDHNALVRLGTTQDRLIKLPDSKYDGMPKRRKNRGHNQYTNPTSDHHKLTRNQIAVLTAISRRLSRSTDGSLYRRGRNKDLGLDIKSWSITQAMNAMDYWGIIKFTKLGERGPWIVHITKKGENYLPKQAHIVKDDSVQTAPAEKSYKGRIETVAQSQAPTPSNGPAPIKENAIVREPKGHQTKQLNLSLFKPAYIHSPVYPYELIFKRIPADQPIIVSKRQDQIAIKGHKFLHYIGTDRALRIFTSEQDSSKWALQTCKQDRFDPSVLDIKGLSKTNNRLHMHLTIWSQQMVRKFNQSAPKGKSEYLYMPGTKLGSLIVFDLNDIKPYVK